MLNAHCWFSLNAQRSTLKAIFFILCSLIAESSFATSSPKPLTASATFSLNSNGIASIPAFSLGKPAIIAAINLNKGRFSFDPVLAYDTRMKPWFFDSWLHYKIIKRPKFELRTGINFSNFFSHLTFNDQDIIKGERYWAGAIEGYWKISAKNTLSLSYWSDNGIDPGGISGHYVSLEDNLSSIPLGNKVLFGAGIQLFLISYDGPNDGVFVSPKLSLGMKNIPVTLFFQATQELVSNIEPKPGFKWNVGVAYSF